MYCTANTGLLSAVTIIETIGELKLIAGNTEHNDIMASFWSLVSAD